MDLPPCVEETESPGRLAIILAFHNIFRAESQPTGALTRCKDSSSFLEKIYKVSKVAQDIRSHNRVNWKQKET